MNTIKTYLPWCACALLIAGAITGCTKGPNAKTTGASNGLSLDPGTTNQAPKINCEIATTSSTATRSIHTLSGNDTFFSQNPKAGDTLTFNCASTQDETAAGDLQFFFDPNFNPSAPNWQSMTGAQFTFPVPQPGDFPMAIRVTDGLGGERVKTFSTIVTCATEILPTLDPAGVSVTPTNKLNFFNYAVNPTALSGGTTFSFSWDFNGDGVFDPFSDASPNETWTSSAATSNVYTIFASPAAHQRKIGLKVRNECNFETAFQIPVTQEIPNIDRTPTALAVEKPFHYIQADIHGTPTTNQRVNGDFITTWYPDDKLERVHCDYKFARLGQKAGFTIKGVNWYKGGLKADNASPLLHGMNIQVRDIPDQGTNGEQSFTTANGLVLDSANFRVSAADDGIVAEDYNRRDQTCDIRMRIKRLQPVVPCAADLRFKSDFTDAAVIITGEFDCPQLTNPSTNMSVATNNGKFFCEVAPANQCVGEPCVNGICECQGDNCGGGVPPPQQ